MVLLHFWVVQLYEFACSEFSSFQQVLESSEQCDSCSFEIWVEYFRFPWRSKSLTCGFICISSFLDDPSPWLVGSYAVGVSKYWSARYFFELYWSCCHWTVVSDSLLWVGSQWLITWSPWACIWLQLLLLFPQVFLSSLRNDAHPYMVITWWALILFLHILDIRSYMYFAYYLYIYIAYFCIFLEYCAYFLFIVHIFCINVHKLHEFGIKSA